jgi:hypothetical protein
VARRHRRRAQRHGTWIGGFDLIYSCQDAEVDRRIGSRSVPARFGIATALRASSAVHVVTVAAFAWFGAAAGLGWLWWAGVLLTGAVLVYEHLIVRAHDLSRVNRAFFTANGVIGIGLFAFALADLLRLGLRAGLPPHPPPGVAPGAVMRAPRGSSASRGRPARRTRAPCSPACWMPGCPSTWSSRARRG